MEISLPMRSVSGAVGSFLPNQKQTTEHSRKKIEFETENRTKNNRREIEMAKNNNKSDRTEYKITIRHPQESILEDSTVQACLKETINTIITKALKGDLIAISGTEPHNGIVDFVTKKPPVFCNLCNSTYVRRKHQYSPIIQPLGCDVHKFHYYCLKDFLKAKENTGKLELGRMMLIEECPSCDSEKDRLELLNTEDNNTETKNVKEVDSDASVVKKRNYESLGDEGNGNTLEYYEKRPEKRLRSTV